MTATATPTLGSLTGRAVRFYPVPTPWPSSAGCDKYIHRQLSDGSFLAWDPVYPQVVTGADETSARSCYRPEQSSWWFQDFSAKPSTALGPTFVCPEAFSAAFSTVLGSDATVQTQYTFCCPPSYTFATLLPESIRTNIQCVSTAVPGMTISYQSVIFSPGFVTVTGDDGKVTQQRSNVLTNVATSTVVQMFAATVYGAPVNGYNLVQRQVSSASTGTASSSATTPSTAPTATTTPPPPPPPPPPQPAALGETASGASAQFTGLVPGTIAAVVVSTVFALTLVALGAFYAGRRRRKRSTAGSPEPAPSAAEVARSYHGSDASATIKIHELSHTGVAHELAHRDYSHELPS